MTVWFAGVFLKPNLMQNEPTIFHPAEFGISTTLCGLAMLFLLPALRIKRREMGQE